MLFNSFSFFLLLLPAVAAYWMTPWHRVRLGILFVASLLFYAAHHWPSAFLLVGTIGFNYLAGRLQARTRSLPVLLVAISVNLSLLFWFKYAAFVADSANALLAAVGAVVSVPRPPAFLPLGISFFTFQVVAYQIDIRRGEIEAETSLLRFAVFKCFFPQLIAGPIVRARDLLPQLQELRRFNPTTFHQGLWLLIGGLALKIGVADVLAQFADDAFRHPAVLTTVGAWVGLYAYAFQLFADFWGYSTMAVGLAALFGIVLPLNFNAPYLANTLQDFWRRWHITLSVWFRDYLYIPLGGNRRNRDINLLITMTLAGLWHGAGWNFLLWGFGHGLWLIIERHTPSLPRSWDNRFLRSLRTFLVFHGICLLWVLFRSPEISQALLYFHRLLLPPFTSSKVPGALVTWLIACLLLQMPLTQSFREIRFTQLSLPVQWILASFAGYLILAYAGARIDFIYFTF